MKSIACFLIALGIMAGAFGAHALKNVITPERLEIFKTASIYQVLISVGLLNLSSLSQISNKTLILLLGGIIIFSGSLYLLVLLDLPFLGMLTPLGGTSIILAFFIASWALRK